MHISAVYSRTLTLVALATLLPGCDGDMIPIVGFPHFYPTGIGHWRQTHSLLVGGYHGGAVQQVFLDGSARQQTWLAPYSEGRTHVLRLRIDESRRRVWILDYDAAYVYALEDARLIARVPLPMLQADRRRCLPDMVLAKNGDAFVSDNRVPKIYRATIDGVVSALQGGLPAGQAPGYSAMTLTPDGGFLVAGRTVGDLWRIELSTGRSSRIALDSPIEGACAFQIVPGPLVHRLVVALGFANRASILDLAPDLSSATVADKSWNVYADTPVSVQLVNDEFVFSSSRLSGHRDFNGRMTGGELFYLTKAPLPDLDPMPIWLP